MMINQRFSASIIIIIMRGARRSGDCGARPVLRTALVSMAGWRRCSLCSGGPSGHLMTSGNVYDFHLQEAYNRLPAKTTSFTKEWRLAFKSRIMENILAGAALCDVCRCPLQAGSCTRGALSLRSQAVKLVPRPALAAVDDEPGSTKGRSLVK
jgi:hypothetical protein